MILIQDKSTSKGVVKDKLHFYQRQTAALPLWAEIHRNIAKICTLERLED